MGNQHQRRNDDDATTQASSSVNVIKTVGAVILIFIASCCSVFLLLRHLIHTTSNAHPNLRFPTNLSLSELQSAEDALRLVLASNPLLTTICFSGIYLIKQTFSIPGSAVLNLACGWLFPIQIALPLVAILTTVGASCCFVLSSTIASENTVHTLCEYISPGQIDKIRRHVTSARLQGNLLFVLIGVRVFPFTPNFLLNLTSPWLQIPLRLFSTSVLVGLLPYNVMTTTAGKLLSELKSTGDIWSTNAIVSMLGMSLAFLLPALYKSSQKIKN